MPVPFATLKRNTTSIMYNVLAHSFKEKMKIVARYFLANKANVLSRDTEAQLRQKPTFIDESAAYAEQQSKKKEEKA